MSDTWKCPECDHVEQADTDTCTQCGFTRVMMGYVLDENHIILTFGPNAAIQAEILVDKAFRDAEDELDE